MGFIGGFGLLPSFPRRGLVVVVMVVSRSEGSEVSVADDEWVGLWV